MSEPLVWEWYGDNEGRKLFVDAVEGGTVRGRLFDDEIGGWADVLTVDVATFAETWTLLYPPTEPTAPQGTLT